VQQRGTPVLQNNYLVTHKITGQSRDPTTTRARSDRDHVSHESSDGWLATVQARADFDPRPLEAHQDWAARFATKLDYAVEVLPEWWSDIIATPR
jgi:hypothetical protein